MRFAAPEFFFLLLLLPLYYGIQAYLKRHIKARTPTVLFANFDTLQRTSAGVRARLTWIPTTLRLAALVLLTVAMARPQQEDVVTLMGKGLDIMFCLDMSGSMNAVDTPEAEIAAYQADGKEPPNRLEVAVDTLKKLVRDRTGDRFGLVVFSSVAYLKSPLTLDQGTIVDQLDGLVLDSLEREPNRDGCINGCTIDGESTAIGDALSKAYKRLEDSDGKGKIIILITDGNDNASRLKPLDVARYIGDLPESSRPHLYTFLIGGGNDTYFPALMQGRQLRRGGHRVYAPKNEPVDETRIRAIAEESKGVFQVSYNEEEFRQAFEELERSEHLEQRVVKYKELFSSFLLAGLLLILLEFLLRVTFLRRIP